MSTLSIPPSSMPPRLSALGPVPSFNTLNLPTDDGEPLESNWHLAEIYALIHSMLWHWRDRKDYFAGGNMFVYFDPNHAKDRNFRGPDFFLVKDVPWGDRVCWITWKEGRVPNLIVELMSPTTKTVDLTTKRDIYEQILQTPEYVAYDPTTRELFAWRLRSGVYQPLPANAEGRIYLEQVDLWIGTAECVVQGQEGVWLRFFDADGRMVPMKSEAEESRADAAEVRAEKEAALKKKEALRADREAIRADAEAAKAKVAEERAKSEAAKAKTAEERAKSEAAERQALAREVAELKARIAKSEK